MTKLFANGVDRLARGQASIRGHRAADCLSKTTAMAAPNGAMARLDFRSRALAFLEPFAKNDSLGYRLGLETRGTGIFRRRLL